MNQPKRQGVVGVLDLLEYKMQIKNIKHEDIDINETGIIVYGEGDFCEKAADVAAAQYRPCILLGAKEKYFATKYEPLYLDKLDRNAMINYIASFEYAEEIKSYE